MKNDSATITIQSIQFLIRRPWFFICPAVVIISIVLSYASIMINDYECSTTISVGSASGSIVEKSAQARDELFSNMLVGSGINSIIKEAWPNIDEKKDPDEYAAVVTMLRTPKKGLDIRRDRRDQSLITLSFTHRNPKICYKVVRAALDYVLKENKQASEEKIEAGVAFLRKQIDFYRDKIKKMDEDMSTLKIKLRTRSGNMSEDEKALIDEITSDSPVQGKQELAVQKSAKYEEILADLDLQLLEAEKRRNILKRRLENKDFTGETVSTENVNEDPLVKEYNTYIAAKQLAVAELMAKGYTKEHPDVKKLLTNVEDLNNIKNKRVSELTGGGSSEMSESDKKIAEQNMKTDIGDLEAGIETLKEKIAMMEKRQQSSENKLNSTGSRFSEIADDASKIVELKNEKEITMTYYRETRKQLEEALLKARIEESGAGFIIKVVEEPKEPTKPLPLKKASVILMGIMLGLGTGVGLAYLADAMDKSIKSSAELRDIFKVPVLASIERMNTAHEISVNNARRIAISVSLLVFVVLSRVMVGVILLFLRVK